MQDSSAPTTTQPGAPFGQLPAGGTTPFSAQPALPAPSSSPALPDSAAPPSPLDSGRRRWLLLAAAFGTALVLAGGGYLVATSGRSGDGSGPADVPAPTGALSPSGTGTRSTPGLATPRVSLTTGQRLPGVASGRNPFLPPVEATAATSAPGVSTSAATQPTVTVTVSATSNPTYVGLYGYISGTPALADFWVNAGEYKVAVGGTFAGLTYVSRTSDGCATLKKGNTITTLCPGAVKKLS